MKRKSKHEQTTRSTKHKQHKRLEDFSTRIALQLGEDFVLVYDPKKDEWDFSGGKRKPGEHDFRYTGRRECFEEMGILIRFDQIELLSRTQQLAKSKTARHKHDLKKHYHLYFCRAFVTDAQVNFGFPISKEHELVEIVTRSALIKLIRAGKFSDISAGLAEKHGLLKT